MCSTQLCGVILFLLFFIFLFLVEKSSASESKSKGSDNIVAQTFTFSELATATRNFRKECLIGEGGFSRVYKGYLAGTSQVLGFSFTFLKSFVISESSLALFGPFVESGYQAA